MEIKSPYNGRVVGKVEVDSQKTLEEKMETTKKGFEKMKRLSKYERAEILIRASRMIKETEEEFVNILVGEVGKTKREALEEVRRCVETIKLSGEEARRLAGEEIPFSGAPKGIGKIGFYQRSPIGIVGAITPFNFPLNLVAHKIGPALAAGCSIILKPASKTPLSAIKLKEILINSGIPEEALQIVIGPGEEIGMGIVRHPLPRAITFTGSKEVGEKIAKNAGMKKIILELGSNSTCIIFKDADICSAAKKIKVGGYALAGQVCISVQRVYVEEDIFEKFLEKLTEEVKKIKVGDPSREDIDMGPMISTEALEKAVMWIEEGIKEGAKPVLEGKREGNLLYPWIIKDAPHDSKLIQQELFAPVVVVNKFRDVDEAIRFVNDTPYGLQAGIFTKDINKALTTAQQIDVGGVLINEVPTFRVDLMPYGGVKGSGLGREGPAYAIKELTEEKLIIINLAE